VSKNAYQVLGLLKTACLEEIEMAYALKTYQLEDINQYIEAVNILRDEIKRAYLNMELPYYLPVGWNMAHINHLPEYRDFVLGNINSDLQSIESEEPYLNMLSGTAFYLQGEFNKALDYYLKTEIQLLDDKHLYFNIALTYAKLNNLEKASAYIKSILPSLSYIELALALKKFPLNREEILLLLNESSKQSASAYWEVLEVFLSITSHEWHGFL
jgi:tetratricopeptide (TPR) repeat protein